jgi:two-component system, NtrC family, response regulator AtoC
MRILLVEDDVSAKELLADYIDNKLGHDVTACSNGREALESFRQKPFNMVLSDIRMPKMNGISLLQSIKALPEGRTTDFVLLTGYGNMDTAIQALRLGAYDYLLKPVNMEELEAVIKRINEHQSLIKDNYELTHRFEDKLVEATCETQSKFDNLQRAFAEVIGVGKMCVSSPEMRKVVAMAEQLHEEPTVPVLIEGETGTGKELIAKLVHFGNSGVTTPLITINSSAISPNLFESELFGYEGGAFSGAKKTGQIGKLELAQTGTILLDEIGDVPLEMQPKLLRVFQEREFYRVGGLKKIKLDARIICATNRNLAQLVKENSFREDLFFRLNTCRIYIPPLRERREDIAPLAQLFLEQYAKQKKRRIMSMANESQRIFRNHSWPGNVRQLQNAIERVVLLNDGEEIRPEHLRFLSSDTEQIRVCEESKSVSHNIEIALPPDHLDLKEIESKVILKILSIFNGNITHAANYLGIARNSLRNKMNRA